MIRLCCLLLCCLGADAAVRDIHLTHDGEERRYLAYVPAAAWTAPRQVRGLVLVLHGGGGTPEHMRELTRRGFEPLAERDDAVVVYPAGLGTHWNDDRPGDNGADETVDDVGFLLAVADDAARRWNADAQNLVVTGHSNGGMMSLRLAREAGQRVRAVAPVASSLPLAATTLPWDHPVPLYLIHGDRDRLVPYRGGMVEVLGTERGRVIGAEATAERLAAINGLPGTRRWSLVPDRADDGTRTVRYRYHGSLPGTAVQLDRVMGGGHTWPGGDSGLPQWLVGVTSQDYVACRAIWAFAAAAGEPTAIAN